MPNGTVIYVRLFDGANAVVDSTLNVVKTTTDIQFDKSYGVIDVVWIDEQNNVIQNPLSPKEHLRRTRCNKI